MSKVDEIKQKLTGLQATLLEKLDKIAFLKKFRQPKSTSTSPGKKPDPSLTTVYREGSTLTRLQVLLVYVLFLSAVVATGYAGKKFLARLKQSDAHENLKQEMSHGLEEFREKVVEKANMVSVGRFTVNVFAGGRPNRLMAVDIWLRMNDPDAAGFVQKNESVIHDRITDSFQGIYQENVDLLEEHGKQRAKALLLESINKSLPKGKAEEVFFENLIIQ
jgi:flagellar basal body-associated protein FliL